MYFEINMNGLIRLLTRLQLMAVPFIANQDGIWFNRKHKIEISIYKT